MSIDYSEEVACLSGFLSVEEAEGLLEWLSVHPQGRLDLSACSHLHSACLQVLMAAKPALITWPTDPSLALWLRNTLSSKSSTP